MSVVIKRSEGGIRNECGYGCCTDVYGKNTKHVRRRMKRAEKARMKREIAREMAYSA